MAMGANACQAFRNLEMFVLVLDTSDLMDLVLIPVGQTRNLTLIIFAIAQLDMTCLAALAMMLLAVWDT